MSRPGGAATFEVAAAAYDRHVGRYGPELAAGLIAAAGVSPGQRALDVGCGPGALTTVLVEVCGAEAVAAVDPSEPLATACAQRAPGADVRLASAESLPFDDSAFDCVLSQLVLNFMSDTEAGVREMCRVTRPGGMVAAAVWDYAGEMTLLRAFWDSALAVDPERASGLDEGRVMRWCRPDELEELWDRTSLTEVAVTALEPSAEYESFDSLWEPFEQGVAPSGAYVSALDAGTRGRLREELRRRLGSPEGPFRLSARAWCAVGRLPA